MAGPISRCIRLTALPGAAPLRALAACVAVALHASAAAGQQAVRGDVDGDGRVTATDARLVREHVAGRPLPPGASLLPQGDADGNGRVTAVDAAVIAGYAAGRDLSRYPVGQPIPPGEVGRLAGVRCEARIAERTVACGERPGAGPAADLIVGGGSRHFALASSDVQVVADTFMFDVAVRNLIRQPLAVDSLGAVDPQGVRVFFSEGPAAPSGTLEVANADGIGVHTGSGQPYFVYRAELGDDGRLSPDETSAPRRWKVRFGGGATTFTFVVHLSAAVPHPRGWIEPVAGDGLADTVAQTLPVQPAVRVLDAFGDPVPGEAVTFAPTANGQLAGASAVADSDGIARAGAWTLRTRAGTDSLRVRAGSRPALVLTAGALPDAPAHLVKSAGDAQWGPARRALGIEPQVTLTDRHGNGIAGVPVSFRVSQGGGALGRATAPTDSSGRASPGPWSLGSTLAENRLEASAAGLPALVFTASVRPNIVLVIADDLNDWVGPLGGYPGVVTPHLDRLASLGLTFERAYAPSPLCNPSRSALLTGVRPSSSGIYGNGGTQTIRRRLPGAVTLPEFMRRSGYYALGIGKVFHSPTALSEDSGRWSRYVPPVWPDPVPPEQDSGVDLRWGPVDMPDESMSDYLVATQAIEFLGGEHPAPFFLSVGFFRPHRPWYVPRRYYDMYPVDAVRLPEVPGGDLDDLPPAGRAMAGAEGPSGHVATLAGRPWPEAVRGYLASITFMDAQLGRVMEALEASPHRESTILVFIGDNGQHLGEKSRWHKSTLWTEAERVPFLVLVPGLTLAGSRSTRPVDLMSLYPTLAELAGLPLEVPQRIEGVSIRPLLANPAAAWSHPAVATYLPGNHSVRTEQWHYVRYADGGEELYDVQRDPREWRNLAADPAMASVIASLRPWLPNGY